MKTFASKEKRSAPAARKTRPYVHHPMSPVQQTQQAEIRRILRCTGAQAKLTIGQPNDKYEQEADRVADQVMAMPDPKLQRQPENEEEEEAIQTKPVADQITPIVQRQIEPEEEEEEPIQAKFKDSEIIQRMCPECEEETAQRQPTEEEEEELQAKSKPGETPAVTPDLESRIRSLKSSGQPLSESARSYFEPRFGKDFSRVRVHNDTRAASTANAVNARAFALGSDVVFRAGEYRLGDRGGRELLAHELTHVVQQGVANSAHKYGDSTVPRVASLSARRVLQRFCGPDEIPEHRDSCIGMSGEADGDRVLFDVNCDTLRPGQEATLRSLASDYTILGNVLAIHGFASEEGDADFNARLSCQRAIVARRVLHAAGVPWHQMILYYHGATPGNREEHRSVVIQELYGLEPIDPYGNLESTAMIFPWTKCGVELLLGLDSEGQQVLTAMEGMEINLCDNIEGTIWTITVVDPTGNVTFNDILENRERYNPTVSHRDSPHHTFLGYYLAGPPRLYIRRDLHNYDAAGVLRHEVTHRYEGSDLDVMRETTAWRWSLLIDIGLTEDQFESELPSVEISDEERQAIIAGSQHYTPGRVTLDPERGIYQFTKITPEAPVDCVIYSGWSDLPEE
jgi:outer membrane protein OmpA-like peptidoglycan-associated protein